MTVFFSKSRESAAAIVFGIGPYVVSDATMLLVIRPICHMLILPMSAQFACAWSLSMIASAWTTRLVPYAAYRVAGHRALPVVPLPRVRSWCPSAISSVMFRIV